MNKDEMISEEAFNELINGFEYIESLTLYGRKNIKYHVQKLQRENEELKEFKEEHKIMKQLLIENGLWETLLNDDRFLNHLKNDNENYKSNFDILTEFEKWIAEEINRYNNLINPKNSLNPYGEELVILENSRNCYIYCKDRLQELKEGGK